jgi:hypothetical protein
MPKAAVVVFSELDSDHGDKARVVNALQIAREFKEAGDEVKVIFDGGGVTAVAAMCHPEHQLHRLYELIAENVEGACAFCAKAFGVKEQLEAAGVPFVSDYKQHPSFRSLVVDGYEMFTL